MPLSKGWDLRISQHRSWFCQLSSYLRVKLLGSTEQWRRTRIISHAIGNGALCNPGGNAADVLVSPDDKIWDNITARKLELTPDRVEALF